ncbi:hypothetical protein [Ensifer sp. SL37]|uniref:hypothetical protein n=1 Tax=Ensifer sp. SL37 TaxID=2995137 RepID=UPI0011BE7539|nr:hypothetical protein [Ensifer sp. SL37]MCY1745132.1 hypothetical protein [Ensifer sp. SL37]
MTSLAADAGIEAAVAWVSEWAADCWLASIVQLSAPVDGPAIAIIWLIGVVLLGALALLLSRMTRRLQ